MIKKLKFCNVEIIAFICNKGTFRLILEKRLIQDSHIQKKNRMTFDYYHIPTRREKQKTSKSRDFALNCPQMEFRCILFLKDMYDMLLLEVSDR